MRVTAPVTLLTRRGAFRSAAAAALVRLLTGS